MRFQWLNQTIYLAMVESIFFFSIDSKKQKSMDGGVGFFERKGISGFQLQKFLFFRKLRFYLHEEESSVRQRR